jgi:hypothetical protein
MLGFGKKYGEELGKNDFRSLYNDNGDLVLEAAYYNL